MVKILNTFLKNKRIKPISMSFVVSENNNKLGFYESISLKFSDQLENKINVTQLNDGNVLVSNSSNMNTISLRRPSSCPFATLKQKNIIDLPPSRLQWIAVASVALLENNDGLILLTKRASHLRTFPNVWVAAGGHVDTNENLEDAALRELFEETGIELSRKDIEISLLCAWESTFPTFLNFGMPRNHHLVLYYKVVITNKNLEMDKLSVNVDEVSEYCWLDKDIVAAIVRSFTDPLDLSILSDYSEKEVSEKFEAVKVTSINSKLKHEKIFKPLTLLTSNVDETREMDLVSERVSTGTKYALYEWLKSCRNII